MQLSKEHFKVELKILALDAVSEKFRGIITGSRCPDHRAHPVSYHLAIWAQQWHFLRKTILFEANFETLK